MALQSQAQLLDELMGKHRNAGPGARVSATKFDDDDVCKYALASFCPHDLFVNTRADLGPCNKIHDEELKKQYEKSSRYGKLGFEDEFEEFVRGLLTDVEKRIRRGNERLKLTQSDLANQKTPVQIKEERVVYLKEQINSMIKQAERLGEEGRIEEAQDMLESSEKLKSECKHLENQLENNQHGSEQKQMEVCDVCGSFLIINDAQSRIEEHISGKQHMGYAKLRESLEQLRKKRMEINEKRDRDRDRDRGDRNRDRNRDYDRDRHNKNDLDRSRNRSRSKDRHRSHRESRHGDRDGRRRSSHSRSPSRTSNGGGSHSTSKSHSSSSHKHHRSRSRDRESSKHSSSRHRSRSRSGSRSRKSRHHSQDRHKRSRRDETNGHAVQMDQVKYEAGSNGHDSESRPKNGDKSPSKEGPKAPSSEREEGETF